MVLPPPASAPSWAAASIPRAIPLTTVIPSNARSAESPRANSFPAAVGERVPTTATASPQAGQAPRQYRTSGASGTDASRGGYSSEPRVTIRAPIRAHAPRTSCALSPASREVDASIPFCRREQPGGGASSVEAGAGTQGAGRPPDRGGAEPLV